VHGFCVLVVLTLSCRPSSLKNGASEYGGSFAQVMTLGGKQWLLESKKRTGLTTDFSEIIELNLNEKI